MVVAAVVVAEAEAEGEGAEKAEKEEKAELAAGPPVLMVMDREGLRPGPEAEAEP